LSTARAEHGISKELDREFLRAAWPQPKEFYREGAKDAKLREEENKS